MRTFCSIAVAACCFGACAQGTFRNLGFEEAELVFVPGSNFTLEASRAVPGWSIGTDWLAYNTIALSSDLISLHDSHSIYVDVLRGNYSILFQMSSDFSRIPELWQTGKVPELSLSLRFVTDRPYPSIGVAFNGDGLPLTQLSTGNDGVVWGTDISSFAGQTGELRFWGDGVLDRIEFSPVAIPEPGLWSLALLGGGVVMVNRRNRG